MAKASEKKTRGRPAESTTLEQIGPDFVTETPQDMRDEEAAWRARQIETDRNLAVVDMTYGENLPYDMTRLENECRFYLQESAGAMLEAGKRLIVLKEHEGHGNFTESVERIGIDPRAARRLMQAAIKFSGPKRSTFAVLGRSKMLELMLEDDEDLDALADGGTVAGLKLDDIEKMSVRELKAELRAAREKRKQEEESNGLLLQKKDQTINRLEKEFNERSKRVKRWDGVVSEIIMNLATMGGGAVMNLCHLTAQIEQILNEADQHNLSDEEMAAIVVPFNDCIQNIAARLENLQIEFEQSLIGYTPVLQSKVSG